MMLAISGVLGACAQARDPGKSGEVGTVGQAAQFADDTIVNLVDPGNDTGLMLTAGPTPVTVDVFYIGAKTTDTGNDPGEIELADTIALGSNQTVRHKVRVHDQTFHGGYGSLVVTSQGGELNELFQTFVQYGGSMFSAGGSVFTGSSYRVPYWDKTLKVVLVVTNQGDFPFDVQISNVGTTEFKTVTLPVLSTYKFDSRDAGFTITGTNSIQVLTSDGGVIALSGYLDRLHQRVRITPVKAAPYNL